MGIDVVYCPYCGSIHISGVTHVYAPRFTINYCPDCERHFRVEFLGYEEDE